VESQNETRSNTAVIEPNDLSLYQSRPKINENDVSKVVDENGEPLVVYSGHSNFELYGDKFQPKRGTSGGFYASESSDVASNYSTGKMGNMEGYEDGSQYVFQLKNGKFGKRLDQIEFNPEQQKIVDQHIQELGYDVVQYWKDNRAYDVDARRALARGGLRDAQSVFKFLENMGENIWYADHNDNRPYFEKQQKSNFEEILDKTGIKWQPHERAQPGVFALYQNIKNPIDVDKPFPPELLAALKQKAGRVRDKYDSSQTQWTRDYPLRDWIESIENGDEYWNPDSSQSD
jgi:hypothetical protein